MAHAKDYEDSLIDEEDEQEQLESISSSSDEAVSSGAEEDSAAEEDYDARDLDPDLDAPSNLGANYRTRGEGYVPSSTSKGKRKRRSKSSRTTTTAEPEFLTGLLGFIETHKDCDAALDAQRKKHAEEKAAWEVDRERLEARVAELEAYQTRARQAARELHELA